MHKKLIIYLVITTLLFFGCKDILTVEDISEKTVFLIAPFDQGSLETGIVNFSWEEVDYAEEYRLQVITPNFKEPLQQVLDTVVTTSFDWQLEPGTYQWRVKAQNSAFATAYSPARNLLVNDIPFEDKLVQLIFPADNINSNSIAQTLRWNPITAASSYNVQILDEQEQLVQEASVSDTTFDHTFTEGVFSWQVSASDGTLNTVFSKRNILIDTTAPNDPVPVLPANNSTASAGNIGFSWNRVDVPGSIEKDSIFIYTDNTLQDLVVKDQGTDLSFTTSLGANTFFWIVKTYDAAGNSSAFSETFTFVTN